MIVIRQMITEDVRPMMRVNRRCFPNPWSAWTVKTDIERNDTSTWMVLEDNPQKPRTLRTLWGLLPSFVEPEVMGFIGFWLVKNEAHITSLGVDPDYRGRGWGEVLLNSALLRAMAWDARFSSLEVRVSNVPAIRLYEKYGYQIKSRKAGYYQDNNEDAYLMVTDALDHDYAAMLEAYRARLTERLVWRDTYLCR